MEKKNDKDSKKYFEYYMAERENEFRSRYQHEKSWNALQARIWKRKVLRVGLYTVTASAACLLLALGTSHIFSLYNNTQQKDAVVAAAVSFPETGSRKAILTLEDGEQVDLSARNGDIAQTSSAVIRNEANQALTYRQVQDAVSAPKENTLTVPRGGEYQLVLADGTRVWMNAESELRYPTSFSGKHREVYLEGEAFFEVAKDPDHTFIVHTARHSVEALGTSFNVSAYAHYKVYTTLAEGKVRVATPAASVVLTPDHQAVIGEEDDGIAVQEVDASLFTSWAKGNYEFRNTPLEEIAAQLSRWYDVDIRFEDDALKYKRFAGVIFRQEELSFAIEVIEQVSDVRFVRKDGKIYIEERRK